MAGVPHVPGWLHTKQRLNHDPLEFIQADLVAPAIVELRCARGKHGSPLPTPSATFLSVRRHRSLWAHCPPAHRRSARCFATIPMRSNAKARPPRMTGFDRTRSQWRGTDAIDPHRSSEACFRPNRPRSGGRNRGTKRSAERGRQQHCRAPSVGAIGVHRSPMGQ